MKKQWKKWTMAMCMVAALSFTAACGNDDKANDNTGTNAENDADDNKNVNDATAGENTTENGTGMENNTNDNDTINDNNVNNDTENNRKPMVAVGISQVMPWDSSRYTPPAISPRAELPMTPLVLPMAMASISTVFPEASSASGVAAETPSRV